MLGALYGVSLLLVHQALWDVGPALGEHPPASAVDFAARFASDHRELALRAYTSGIAMVIGLGTGLVLSAIAVGARVWRSRRG